MWTGQDVWQERGLGKKQDFTPGTTCRGGYEWGLQVQTAQSSHICYHFTCTPIHQISQHLCFTEDMLNWSFAQDDALRAIKSRPDSSLLTQTPGFPHQSCLSLEHAATGWLMGHQSQTFISQSYPKLKKAILGTSLVIQWLRLCTPSVGGPDHMAHY